MKVEIVANKLSDTDASTGQHYMLAKGDAVTVPDAYGRKLCDAGWAKDVSQYDDESQRYASAPFTPGAAKLNVNKLNIAPGARS
jgi:hypothetical protein